MVLEAISTCFNGGEVRCRSCCSGGGITLKFHTASRLIAPYLECTGGDSRKLNSFPSSPKTIVFALMVTLSSRRPCCRSVSSMMSLMPAEAINRGIWLRAAHTHRDNTRRSVKISQHLDNLYGQGGHKGETRA